VQQPPGAKIAVAAAPAAKNFQIGSILEPALWLIGILAFGAKSRHCLQTRFANHLKLCHLRHSRRPQHRL
jgi:hypothetical protein